MLAINSEIVAKAGKYIDIILLSRAYDNYQDDFAAGNDGNPAWLARKSCNYLTATTKVTIDYGILYRVPLLYFLRLVLVLEI